MRQTEKSSSKAQGIRERSPVPAQGNDVSGLQTGVPVPIYNSNADLCAFRQKRDYLS
jgi:hypothetical protein